MYFKNLLNFARRTLNTSKKNRQYCLAVSFRKVFESSNLSLNYSQKSVVSTPIRQMGNSNVTIRSSQVSEYSRESQVKESHLRFNKKQYEEVPSEMNQILQ